MIKIKTIIETSVLNIKCQKQKIQNKKIYLTYNKLRGILLLTNYDGIHKQKD